MRLLLDLGGVVIKTPFEMFHLLGNPSWHGPFEPDADSLWQALQRAEISEREYWNTRALEFFDEASSEERDPMRELFRVLLDHPEEQIVRPEMAAFLQEVVRPAVLTNDMSRFHTAEWAESMTIFRRFNPLIDLSHEPYRKPDPRAFELALERLGVGPNEVLFVDDQPQNLTGAVAVGMQTEWFDVTDVTGSISRIRKALAGG